jgi:tetratricopeptide (TPR) repeat protein
MISLAVVLALCAFGPAPQQPTPSTRPAGQASAEPQQVRPTREQALVSAKTVALFGHLGTVADWGLALNPSAEKAQKHLDKEVRKWGRFTVVSDPAAADLILFLAEGNRAAGGGGVVNTAILTVFKGGRPPQRGDVPLWQGVESSNPFTFSSGTGKVISRFRKDLEDLAQRQSVIAVVASNEGAGSATNTSGLPEKTAPPVDATASVQEGTTAGTAPSACPSGTDAVASPGVEELIPPRPAKYISPLELIAKAKTFAVMGKGALGQQGIVEQMMGAGKYANVDTAMQDVVFQMKLWNRFLLERVPAKADLVILVYQWDERTYSKQFHSMRSAIQVAEGGPAFRRGDPSLWASGTFRGTTKDIVSYLQHDVEQFEKGALSKTNAEPDKSFRNAGDWLKSAEKKKNEFQRHDEIFEAIAEFRKSLRADSGFAPAHAGLGRALLDLNLDAAAAYEFKLALKLDPGSHDSLMDLARAMGKIPDRDAALEAVHEARRLVPDRVDDQVALAEILFSAHDYEGATKAYAEALQFKRSDPDLLFEMGRSQYFGKDFDAAEASFRQALQLQADNGYAFYWLGSVLTEKSRFDEAVPMLRRALALGLKRPTLHFELGLALRGQRKYEEAISEFREALAADPNLPAYHNELAHTFAHAGKTDQALMEFRESVRLSPGSAHFRDDLGDALLTKAQVDEAIVEFNRAIGLDPKYAAAHFDLGRAREVKGDKACALVAYEAALSLEPENTVFQSRIQAVGK